MSLGKIYKIMFLITILLGIGFHSPSNAIFGEGSDIQVSDFTMITRPQTFLIQSDPIHITNDSAFSVFPGSGTKTDPYRLENYNISSEIQNFGINISDTTKFFVIQNCFIKVKQVGIWISWIAHGTAEIRNNTCIEHDAYGIDLWDAPGTLIDNNSLTSNSLNGLNCIDSDDVTISNNVLSLNKENGVSVRFSDDITISNNLCEQNQVGIEVYFSRTPIVEQNYCFDNKKSGIYLWEINTGDIKRNQLYGNLGPAFHFRDSEVVQLKENDVINNTIGFYLDESHYFEIYNNSISNNKNKGIYLFSSNECKITYNFIEFNTGYGVTLNYSSSNLIHQNNFVHNNLGGLSQAYSTNGINNFWYESEIEKGNFWNEWLGTGDYSIEGFWGEFDLYPLEEPVEIPRIEIEKQNWYFYIIVILLPLVGLGVLIYIISFFSKRRRVGFARYSKETTDYINFKRKIAYSKEVGVGLFRFGMKGGEVIESDLESFDINLDEFIGFCYVTVGQGQRYETGVYGPLPAPSIISHSMIIFTFWGKDDLQSDLRFEGKQYYLVSVIFPENKTEHLIKNDVMNKKFHTYIKKFKYPNRMSSEELSFFREIVFI